MIPPTENPFYDARLRALFDSAQTGIVIINQEHRVVDANQAFSRMLGYRHEEVLQLRTWDWEANLSEASIRQKFSDLANIQKRFETVHRRKDGSLLPVEVSASGTVFSGENCIICLCTDIRDRKEKESYLHHLSLHDSLTGLPNRAAYQAHLQELGAKPDGRPVSIISCDMDDLKQINDQNGHSRGDEMIQACARLLRQNVPEPNLVARLGGDEFVIVLRRTCEREVRALKRRICRSLHAYNLASDLPLRLSLGAATSHDCNPDFSALFHQADINMLRFKRLAKIIRHQTLPPIAKD